MQVAHLLESLAINPATLPSSLNHVHDASWHEVWAAGARPPGPSVAADLAAAAAPQNWDMLWQQQQQAQPRYDSPVTSSEIYYDNPLSASIEQVAHNRVIGCCVCYGVAYLPQQAVHLLRMYTHQGQGGGGRAINFGPHVPKAFNTL